jgi:parallel beta-helix repeat protein
MVRAFYVGIRAVNVENLNIENCVVSDNHNPTDVEWLPDADDPKEEGFGAGIYLFRVFDSVIQGNLLNNNFNGLSLVRSKRNRIAGNNASYSGNLGIHLLGSSHNVVGDNQADHCIRYTGRFWCDTADSAGVLLEEDSHHNRITGISLRYSGDGFFIRANNGHSCDHNYIARNDASFSPNNAFEAGFSQHNVFEENVASFSNYGFWLGFSSDTVVRHNRILANRLDGIAIDSGNQNNIQGNKIQGNRNGVRLWSGRPGELSQITSVVRNEINASRECAVLVGKGQLASVEDNMLNSNGCEVVQE